MLHHARDIAVCTVVVVVFDIGLQPDELRSVTAEFEFSAFHFYGAKDAVCGSCDDPHDACCPCAQP